MVAMSANCRPGRPLVISRSRRMVRRMFEARQDEVWSQDSEGMEEWRQVAVCTCIDVFVAPQHGQIEE